jgi:dTDP-4-dehydrorhamnose 3,5-epimerase
MRIKELTLKGVYLIEPELLTDNRGFFTRVFCKTEFEKKGLVTVFPQWSISHNKQKNTIRGMHYQKPPYEEVKIVTCTKGGIYDVLLDLREASKTFKSWISVELTELNKNLLYIPTGIAHGFKTLCDGTDIFYHISELHHPGSGAGVRYDDEAFGIEWGNLDKIVISEKDLTWKNFNR